MTFNLTKTRREMLQAVADGEVTRKYGFYPAAGYAEWDRGPGSTSIAAGARRYQTVTGRIDALELAGLVRLGPKPERYKARRLYEVTEAGQRVLGGAS